LKTLLHLRTRARRGFTLAEVMVTILIVGIGLLLILQGLNTSKLMAAHTRNLKLSRELALITLGQIASGEFQDDIANGLQGTYAEENSPDFTYEVIVGDQSFKQKEGNGPFDSWAPPDTGAQDDKNKDKDEDPKDRDEPFEKVKIKITFPQVRDYPNEFVLEQWIPWKQVYGEKPEDEAANATAQNAGNGGASGGGSTSGGAKSNGTSGSTSSPSGGRPK
jgi:prepilin-type N-terminal cleavage/methylation domain-containing protein